LQLALEFAAESDEVATEAGKQLDQVAGGNVTLKVLQHYVALHPDSATARCQLGVAFLRRRQAREALSAFDAALELDPDQPLALNYAGLLNADAGNLATAETLFRRLILVAPQLAKAHENLGLVVAKQGRPGEALAHYDEALKLDPSSASAHRNAARACEQLGQMEEVRRHREIAEKLKPAAVDTKSGGVAPPKPP
jgi:tetratricopeptide (TPR) repeat protein